MKRRLPYPWGEPPRRLYRRCNVCNRPLLLKRYAFCARCLRIGRELAAGLVD